MLPEVDFHFNGKLKPTQEPAVQSILQRRFSTIESPTGSGKTVMGLYVIAQRRQPALVVVHTTRLLKQWIGATEFFLGIPSEEIGIIGQGHRQVGRRLTVALVQTLYKCAREMAPNIGHLIVDEVHRCPSRTFTEAVAAFDSAYMLGLSATHKRRDGLTPLIYWHVGPCIHRVDRSTLIESGDIVQVEPVIRHTVFEPSLAVTEALSEMTERMASGYRGEETEAVSKEDRKRLVTARGRLLYELTQDHNRNEMIACDVALEAREGPCIVLTDMVEHTETLARMIANWGVKVAACHGRVPKRQQDDMVEAMNDGRLRVLVATGQLLGEGFDCRQITALFLAAPIKFDGRLIQYLGRAARSADGKTSARVYDYVDPVDTLMSAARERARTYRRLAREATGPVRRTPIRRKAG